MRPLGARGVVRAPRWRQLDIDARRRVALIRIAIISAAWALGEALVWQMAVEGLGLVVPALLAVAAFFATRDVSSLGGGDGDPTYWRGRRIDKDRWRH